jgi:hypothetical protein
LAWPTHSQNPDFVINDYKQRTVVFAAAGFEQHLPNVAVIPLTFNRQCEPIWAPAKAGARVEKFVPPSKRTVG